MDNADALGILKRLERGDITAEQADEWFSRPSPVERTEAPPDAPSGAPWWAQRLWLCGVTLGVLIVALGAWIIAATAPANWLWFLAGLPIVLWGSFVLALAAMLQSGHWLYVDVREKGRGRHSFRFGLPFPLGLGRAALRLAELVVPDPQAHIKVHTSRATLAEVWTDADALLDAVERELAEGRGVTVQVDEPEAHVQVRIV